jgi:hypothetical protein
VWADGETDVDLLGFDFLVDELVVALTEPRLLPLTVGVLGDWGSGKSSLLRIAERELAATSGEDGPRYVCVPFSPWQYEDYDDVKLALMRAVLDACDQIAGKDAQAEVTRLRRFVDGLLRAGRRVGRGAAMVAPAAVPVAVAGLQPGIDPASVQFVGAVVGTTANAVAERLEEEPASTDESEVVELGDFRTRFGSLIESLEDVAAVVIFIDDLDRCLPETIVDTFEVIRLFLNAPRMAFVVAANREIVESAIDSRYPDLRRDDNKGIGADYLEKMLQLKVNVPPLSADETMTYVNMLLCELRLDSSRHVSLCDEVRQRRRATPFAAALDLSVAGDLLGEGMSGHLATDLTWAAQVTPALTQGLRGNPRQIKRFLNGLLWRQRAASRRGVTLEPGVLAKLMVLDEQSGADFQRLFDWQLTAPSGPIPELARAEELVHGTDAPQSPGKEGAVATTAARRAAARTKGDKKASADARAEEVEQAVANWAALPRIAAWLKLEPPLGATDLRPYFSFFRDRLIVGTTAARLSPRLQDLLARLVSEASTVRRGAVSEAKTLPEAEQQDVVEALADSIARRPDPSALEGAAMLASEIPALVPAVFDAIRRVPHHLLNATRIPALVQHLPEGNDRVALLASWSSSPVRGVAAAATASTRRRSPGQA